MFAEPPCSESTRRILLVAKAQDKNRVEVLKPKAKTYLVANAQEGLKKSKVQGYLAENIPRSLTYEKNNYTV